MNGQPDEAPPEKAKPTSHAVRRLRMAYRVSQALSFLGPDALVETDMEGEPGSEAYEAGGDFLIQILDFRLRLVLVMESDDPTVLETPEVVGRAADVLTRWPETDAVVFVVGDDGLTAVVLDAFNRSDALDVPSGQVGDAGTAAGPDPLEQVLGGYLELLGPKWTAVAALTRVPPFDLRQSAEVAATEAMEQVEARTYQVPEKVTAHAKLTEGDVEWAAQLAATDDPEWSGLDPERLLNDRAEEGSP